MAKKNNICSVDIHIYKRQIGKPDVGVIVQRRINNSFVPRSRTYWYHDFDTTNERRTNALNRAQAMQRALLERGQ